MYSTIKYMITTLSFVIVILSPLIVTADSSTVCDGKKDGYYCIDDSELLWCHGSSTGSLMKCPAGLTCKCKYYEGFPCTWDYIDLPCDEPDDSDSSDSDDSDSSESSERPCEHSSSSEVPPTPSSSSSSIPTPQPPSSSESSSVEPPVKSSSEPERSSSSERPVSSCQSISSRSSSSASSSGVPPTPTPSSSSSSEVPPAPSSSSSSVPTPQPSSSSEPIVPPPSNNTEQRLIGYFTNWAQYRFGSANGFECKYFPSNVPAQYLTHMNYAFAVFGEDYKLVNFEWNDYDLYKQAQALKNTNPNLKILISIGGWNFNLFDATKHLFTNMAENAQNRKIFIDNCIKFAREHKFDGIDIDWEYPGNPDMGGRPQDKENFTLLLKEFREAIDKESSGSKLLLTIAAPAGPWNIEHLQTSEIHKYLDWINVMTYDLHGPWDGKVGAHTSLYDTDGLSIDDCIKNYLDAGTPSNKLVVGYAFYGKSFTLADENKFMPNDTTTEEGTEGPCTRQPGMLSYDEIKDFIKDGAKTRYDEPTRTMYAYKGRQIVCYDNIETHNEKIKYAKDKNLGGAMIWALDLDLDNGLLKNLYNKVL